MGFNYKVKEGFIVKADTDIDTVPVVFTPVNKAKETTLSQMKEIMLRQMARRDGINANIKKIEAEMAKVIDVIRHPKIVTK